MYSDWTFDIVGGEKSYDNYLSAFKPEAADSQADHYRRCRFYQRRACRVPLLPSSPPKRRYKQTRARWMQPTKPFRETTNIPPPAAPATLKKAKPTARPRSSGTMTTRLLLLRPRAMAPTSPTMPERQKRTQKPLRAKKNSPRKEKSHPPIDKVSKRRQA